MQPAKVVGDVEEDAVAVGDAAVERQDLGGTAPAADGAMERSSSATAPLRPDAPVAEQAAAEAQHDLALAVRTANGVTRSSDDVVVVAGVERDALLGAGRDHAEGDVERAVAVERRDLDGDDVVDRGEAGPEGARSAMPPTAGCR